MRTRFHVRVLVLLTSVVIAIHAAADDAQAGMIAQGTVRDAKNAPIANANVQLCYEKNELDPDNGVIETVQTDQGGKYQFKTPLRFEALNGTEESDHYVVVAYDSTHAPGWANIVGTNTLASNDLILDNGTPQDVQVTDSQGNPLADVTLRLSGAGDPQDRYPAFRQLSYFPPDMIAASDTTDAQGAVTLKTLPRTQLRLTASRPGYVDSWIWLNSPQKNAVAIKMAPAATVKGTVRDSQGHPVKGITVNFIDLNHYAPRKVNTDENGHYECDTLSPVDPQRYGTGEYATFLRGPKLCSAVQNLKIDQAQTIDNYDFTAQPGDVLRIKVVEPQSQKPVAGARVAVTVSYNELMSGFTDENGLFEFHMMAAKGKVGLYAPPGGSYFAGDAATEDFNLTDELTEVTLTLPSALKPLVNVHGLVMTADGKAGSSIKVMLACPNDIQLPVRNGITFGTVTMPDGSFAVNGFPSDTHLAIYAETRNHKSAAVVDYDAPPPDGALKAPIKLGPTSAADFDFDGAIGRSMTGAHVYVAPSAGNIAFLHYARDTTIDAAGHLKIPGIIPGQTYRVEQIDRNPNPVSKDLILIPAK